MPDGAGNDFARSLGLDHRAPLDALALLDTGHETRGRPRSRRTADGGATSWFTTVAHSGLRRRGEPVGQHRHLGDGHRALRAWPRCARSRSTGPPTMRVAVDGEDWVGRRVARRRRQHAAATAGGMAITPDRAVDDGLLDVCVSGTSVAGQVLDRFPRMIRGTHLGIDGDRSTARGRPSVVDGRSTLELYASGERVGPLPGHDRQSCRRRCGCWCPADRAGSETAFTDGDRGLPCRPPGGRGSCRRSCRSPGLRSTLPVSSPCRRTLSSKPANCASAKHERVRAALVDVLDLVDTRRRCRSSWR